MLAASVLIAFCIWIWSTPTFCCFAILAAPFHKRNASDNRNTQKLLDFLGATDLHVEHIGNNDDRNGCK